LATEAGVRAAEEFARSILPPRSQLEVRARSGQSDGKTDLHLSFPIGNRVPDGWEHLVRVEVFKPASTGYVRLQSADPHVRPRIDGRYFSDPEGHDISVMKFGVDLARSLMRSSGMLPYVAHERWPGAQVNEETMGAFARANAFTFHHPAGTCKMGPASDPWAVVDGRGRVHGIDGLHVADASIMPEIPAAVPNLTCMAIGEIVAAQLAPGAPPARALVDAPA
jgi:choline dehydrogenase-like flavoprotein